MRKTKRGTPLFEHALVIVLAALAIWSVSLYIDRLLEQSEATVVSATVMNIRSGLRTEKARRILAGKGVQELMGRNPVSFLAVPPGGYMAADTNRDEAARGVWFYREDDQTLYYRPRYHAHLQRKERGGDNSLGWKVMEVPESPKEIDLVSVTPHTWF